MSARLVALVPAAGRGERFGSDRPKMFLEVAGRPLLAWTVDRLLTAGVAALALAVPEERLGEALRLATARPEPWERVVFTAGGESRQASVAACLDALGGPPDDLLVVHDGARPAFSLRDFEATVEAAGDRGGALLGRPVSDTLKEVGERRVRATIDRSRLFRAETPQVFRRRDLERALDRARADGFVGTDEASLVERLGDVEIAAVAAQDPNPKLTTPGDLPLLEWLLAAGSEPVAADGPASGGVD
jgi:2-C-methyl-D-erythritol 4-phosphate cytidylyltransferase